MSIMQRKSRKPIKKRIIAVALVAAVVCSLVVYTYQDTQAKAAIFNENDCTTFGVYASAHSIPAGTLFIGTYLVSIKSLNDQIYTRAQDAASLSNQTSIYYKSELGGDQWFDITDASDIADISTTGDTASFDDLSSLYVQYYVAEDGTVYNCKSNASVNIFNDPEPYYKPDMEEFEDLFTLYNEGYIKCCDNDTLDLYYHSISDYMRNSGPNQGELSIYDTELNNLYQTQVYCLKNWRDGNKDGTDEEMADVLYEVMESVDAERRIKYFDQFFNDTGTWGYDYLTNLFTNTAAVDDDCSTDSVVANAWAQVQQNIYDSIEEYEQKVVTDPGTDGTYIEQRQYATYAQIVENAKSGVNTAHLSDYVDYNHILNGVVSNRSSELSKLDDDLTPSAINRMSVYMGSLLSAGGSDTYKTYKAAGVEESQLTSVLEDDQAVLETYIGETENYITGRVLRSKQADNETYLAERLTEAKAIQSSIATYTECDFTSYAKSSIAAYITWLSGELSDVEEGLTSDATESESLSALEDEKEALEEQYLEDVQNNDLASAATIEDLINAIDDKIDAATSELEAAANSGDAVAASQLSNSDTLAGTIESLKEDAMEDISDGAYQSDAIDSLVALGATDAIEELKDTFGEDNAALKSAILNAENDFNTNATVIDKKNKLADTSSTSSATDSTTGSSSGGTSIDLSGSTGSSSTGSTGASSTVGGSTNSGLKLTSATDKSAADAADYVEGLSKSDIQSVLDDAMESVTGDSLDDASTEDKLAALAALNAMDDGTNDNTGSLRDSLLAELLNSLKGKGYLYTTYVDGMNNVYVSLNAIAKITDYRYIFDAAKSEADMQRMSPSKTYTFTAKSTAVTISGASKKAKMDYNAVLREDGNSKWLYICNTASQNIFDVTGVPINGKDYSIAMTGEMYTTMKELLDAINAE